MLGHTRFGHVHPSAPPRTGPDRRSRPGPDVPKFFSTVR